MCLCNHLGRLTCLGPGGPTTTIFPVAQAVIRLTAMCLNNPMLPARARAASERPGCCQRDIGRCSSVWPLSANQTCSVLPDARIPPFDTRRLIRGSIVIRLRQFSLEKAAENWLLLIQKVLGKKHNLVRHPEAVKACASLGSHRLPHTVQAWRAIDARGLADICLPTRSCSC